jgi:phage-related minor tail protein
LKLGEGTLPLLIPGNNAGGYIGRTIQALREGGTVGALVQRFAGGGTVFRRPSWSKVPGVGDADTVPAALPVGSYVVRKAASGYYGDALMSILSRGLLARAFGGGGPGGARA